MKTRMRKIILLLALSSQMPNQSGTQSTWALGISVFSLLFSAVAWNQNRNLSAQNQHLLKNLNSTENKVQEMAKDIATLKGSLRETVKSYILEHPDFADIVAHKAAQLPSLVDNILRSMTERHTDLMASINKTIRDEGLSRAKDLLNSPEIKNKIMDSARSVVRSETADKIIREETLSCINNKAKNDPVIQKAALNIVNDIMPNVMIIDQKIKQQNEMIKDIRASLHSEIASLVNNTNTKIQMFLTQTKKDLDSLTRTNNTITVEEWRRIMDKIDSLENKSKKLTETASTNETNVQLIKNQMGEVIEHYNDMVSSLDTLKDHLSLPDDAKARIEFKKINSSSKLEAAKK